MPKLSIIIVSYNTRDLLHACLRSISKFKGNLDLEVIVVDNASSDGSINGLQTENLKLDLIQNRENLGFARANNQGLKKASGEYFLLLNSDTVITENSLESLLKFAQKTPDAGVVGSRLLNSDGTIQASCFHFPTISNALKTYFMNQDMVSKYYPKTINACEVDSLVGAAFLITPQAIKEAGLLDERYFMYFEDIDYCRKVKDCGLKVYYLADSQIYHYHGASGRVSGQNTQNQRLIASSKIYHGLSYYYLYTFILKIGQKWQKMFQRL